MDFIFQGEPECETCEHLELETLGTLHNSTSRQVVLGCAHKPGCIYTEKTLYERISRLIYLGYHVSFFEGHDGSKPCVGVTIRLNGCATETEHTVTIEKNARGPHSLATEGELLRVLKSAVISLTEYEEEKENGKQHV